MRERFVNFKYFLCQTRACWWLNHGYADAFLLDKYPPEGEVDLCIYGKRLGKGFIKPINDPLAPCKFYVEFSNGLRIFVYAPLNVLYKINRRKR